MQADPNGLFTCKPGFSGLDLNLITETFKIFNHGKSDPDLDLNDISKLGPSKLQLLHRPSLCYNLPPPDLVLKGLVLPRGHNDVLRTGLMDEAAQDVPVRLAVGRVPEQRQPARGGLVEGGAQPPSPEKEAEKRLLCVLAQQGSRPFRLADQAAHRRLPQRVSQRGVVVCQRQLEGRSRQCPWVQGYGSGNLGCIGSGPGLDLSIKNLLY